MAYFKLSLLTKAYDKSNVNKYIKNVISEFYGNNVDEDLLRYERENNLQSSLTNGLINIYTKTYTYNEKLNIHQQGQADLTFSLDKMILDDDTWKENPFASKLKSGGQVLLEDKYNNTYLFTIKDITYTITENNIVYNFTCQDSFSYQLAKQNDGYTINNDINSKDFIGALSIDYWAEKIVKECKIAYKYLKLETPLYLCKDGTAINTTNTNKQVLKILKQKYLNTTENADLYEKIPFSCSSTTANGALISLGEQIGLVLNTATVLLEPENNKNFINLITYFWFEPSKKDAVNGLAYSPFRNVKTFNLSQKADSLITTLNINSRTLSNDEVITALPTVSPFFINYFNSSYWKKYSNYYPGMYTNALYGPQYSMSSVTDLWEYGTASAYSEIGKIYIKYSSTYHTITFSTRIDAILKAQFSLYDTYIFQSKDVLSSLSYWDTDGDLKVATASNSTFDIFISSSTLQIQIQNMDFADMRTDNYINNFDITVFFKKDFSDEDEIFARIADQLPWLENKLIDYSYFLNVGLLSKIQKQDINNRINNELRKVNADILLNAAAYYGRIHSQTKYLAEMTDKIDSVGAEISSIVNLYKRKEANNNYDANNLILRWSLLQANISDAAAQTGVANSSSASTFMNLYETTSDYMRKFLNARQRCLKNLYNFRSYYETPLDPLYKQYYEVTLTIQDTTPTQEEPSGAENIYRFEPQPKDEYRALSWQFVEDFPQFFITDDDSTYLIDYNNINLYNNDIQHSIFDKENHLITTDNVSNLDLHCYQDVLQKCGEENYYDKDTQYLRQVFFVKLKDICDYFVKESTSAVMTDDDINSLTDANLLLNFATYDPLSSNPILLYPCQSKIYKEDRNYLVCNKMYEDGAPFNYEGICLLADSTIKVNGTTYVCDTNDVYITLDSDEPRYVGASFNRTDLEDDTINFIDKNADQNSITVRLDGSVFYQPIDSIDILRNYLYRKNFSNTYIKENYELIPLNDPTDNYKNALFYGNTIDTSRYAPDTTRYVTVNDADITYSQDVPGDNKIGWGVATNSAAQIWHIISAIATIGGGLGLLPTGFRTLGSVGLLISALNLKNKMLVYGGYSASNTHLDDGLFSDFAPYASKEVKNDSLYIQNFPLDTIYDKNGNSTTLVTATNYQNFYTRTDSTSTSEDSFSLGSEGVYKSVDSAQYQIGKSEKDLCTDFISDFPIHYFYTTKPISGVVSKINNTGVIATDFTSGAAFTFGNLLNNFTYFANDPNFNFKYRKTITYRKTEYSSLHLFKDDASFLVVDTTEVAFNIDANSWPSELNQYIHYDIINHSKIMSKAQFRALPSSSTDRYIIYLIIDGIIKQFSSNTVIDSNTEMVTSIKEMFTKKVSDYNGRSFNINEYQNYAGIIENLYYIEQDVLSTQSSLNYSLKEHLYDNTYEWYNKDEERVYTTNQLFGNLLYKKPQTYKYYIFDKEVDQYIKMYRYNYNSITPDIFTYRFDVSNINNSTLTNCTGEAPYNDFKYSVYIIQISSGLTGESTNGDFWYKFTMEANNKIPLREHAALIESDLQLYWNEAYAASLLCDIFVPDEWRIKQDKIINRFNVISKPQTGSTTTSLNSVYIPKINKTTDKQYIITWKDVPPQVENSEIFSYDELSYEQKIEVDKMLERTQNVSTNNLYFTKISDNTSFYTIQTGGCNWATFLNQAVGIYLPDYTGWNGTAITYLTSHFVDAGMSNYELLLERREDLWRDFYNEYPYLFLESSYTNDSATTSEDLLTMAKYAFEDQKYPEKSYSISLIDLVQDVETLDNTDRTYKPVYYREPELHIGEGIKISVEDYTQDRDDIYEALSQLLFITDISRDLRNDGNCQLTVNTIKYQDKLIRRLAKMIRRNPLN